MEEEGRDLSERDLILGHADLSGAVHRVLERDVRSALEEADERGRMRGMLDQLGAREAAVGNARAGVWRADALEERVREFANENAMKLGAVAQPLRGALTGSVASPGIFMVMEVLGREETLGRIADAVSPVPLS